MKRGGCGRWTGRGRTCTPAAEWNRPWKSNGTPPEVRDGLQQYRDVTGYERVLLVMALPGLDTSLALRSMRLFAEEVAPAMAPVAGQRSNP